MKRTEKLPAYGLRYTAGSQAGQWVAPVDDRDDHWRNVFEPCFPFANRKAALNFARNNAARLRHPVEVVSKADHHAALKVS